MDIQKELIRVTAEYFEDNIDYQKLATASKEYGQLLNELCGQNMAVEDGRSNIELDNGEALGTYWAALCLEDLWRTRQFIRGINEVIKEKRSAQKPIHLLYAGSGPFATLILPFLVRYSKQEIKYTLLEINPFSYQLVQNVLAKLGLDELDITFVNADTTQYKIDPTNKPDIIVSETMQNALAKEPQVPIFLNLMRQVKNDSIFIPEKIELYVGLKKSGIPNEELQAKHFHKEAKVVEVSKEAMFSAGHSEKRISYTLQFPKKQTIIENEKLNGFDCLVLITEIQVYKNEGIGINRSGLTTPIIMEPISSNLKGSITIDTQYKISSDPKLEYTITMSATV